MKKIYEDPDVKVIVLIDSDVITVSGPEFDADGDEYYGNEMPT